MTPNRLTVPTMANVMAIAGFTGTPITEVKIGRANTEPPPPNSPRAMPITTANPWPIAHIKLSINPSTEPSIELTLKRMSEKPKSILCTPHRSTSIDEDKGLKPLAPTTIGALPVPKDTFQTSSKK
jgi:hypothetical protein